MVVKRAMKKEVLQREAAFWLSVKAIHAKSTTKKCHK
jgi:P pilus assembly chaperone PapD